MLVIGKWFALLSIAFRVHNLDYFHFSRYIGTYGNFAYGNISVVEVGEDLDLVYGTRVWNLLYQDDDVFIGYANVNTG